MSGPQRLQLRRTKGWRIPPGAVKVDRSTRWGNPFAADTSFQSAMTAVALGFRADPAGRRAAMVELHRRWLGLAATPAPPLGAGGGIIGFAGGAEVSIAQHCRNIAAAVIDPLSPPPPPTLAEIRTALRGKDLACWCPLDGPCHAHTLLEIANG